MALHWKIIIGLIAGIIWAVVSSMIGLSSFTINWIAPWGDIFIRVLKMIAVPLVLFSIIKGVSGITDGSSLGRMGVKTLLAYLFTTIFAITIGLTLVNVIQPGKFVNQETRIDNRISYELWVNETDGVEIKDKKSYLNDPTYANEVAAVKARQGSKVEQNDWVKDKLTKAKNTKDDGPLKFIVDMVPTNFIYSLSNGSGKPSMLQVIFFAIFFGLVLLQIPTNKAKPVIDFVDGLNEVFIKMVDIIMNLAPFFVFALMAGVISKLAGDDVNKVIEIFKGLGVYSLVVVLGLLVMIFGVYATVVHIFTKKTSYRNFLRGISPAQLLAFSTSSSAATLPVTIDCVRDNLGVDKNITSFVLPIGATVNMDGTSLYQAVAVIFLAQFHLVDLTLGAQLTVVLTATLASIGAAAVPSAGLVMLIIVLESVGLNPAWIAIIFPVDRILDMCRTVVNVTGDATVSTLIAHSEAGYKKPEEI